MKITKKQVIRHALGVAKNAGWAITSYLSNKTENSLLSIPVVGTATYLRDLAISWADRKINSLGQIPCVYTSEFAPIKSFIEEIISKDLPYTNLTVLLYGNPGTGKSFFVSMAASITECYVEDLAPQLRFGTEKGNKSYNDGRGDVGSLYCPSPNTSFSVKYLNEIDRYCESQQADPVLEASLVDALDKPKRSLDSKSVTILTTNYLERIPDFLRRPGRIDLIIEVQGMSEEECKKMMKLYNFEGSMPPQNEYGKYSPGQIYDHMRRNSMR